MKKFIAADLFCGAGGTSTGLIRAAKNAERNVQLTAINHWDVAIETHSKNHPSARHLCSSIDNLNPSKLFPGGRINLLVASPECTHHSVARGGRPSSDQSRAGAWEIVRWASTVYIDSILIENVPEFESWGPLGIDGLPMKSKRGQTFQAFKIALQSMGYRVESRVLNAADYGDPQARNRLFMIARRGNKKIRWPEPTHTETGRENLFGATRPWVPARDIIDWSLPGQSIFHRKKPLAEKTLARIEYGLRKFGGSDFLVKFFGTGKGVSLSDPLPTVTANGTHFGVCEPFIAIHKGRSKSKSINGPLPTITTKQHLYLCEPFLTRFHGGKGSEKRVHDVSCPLPVVDTSNRYGLVEAFILPQQAGRKNQLRVRSIEKPLTTITTTAAEMLVEPFILKYFGTGTVGSINKPLDTITTKDRFALVETFRRHPDIDIRLRMLQPHELAAAQSFPSNYKFAGNKTEIVRQIGNAVPVRTAEALCRELIE
jgi:DNA (cytosine-5)-methyltransferase 1